MGNCTLNQKEKTVATNLPYIPSFTLETSTYCADLNYTTTTAGTYIISAARDLGTYPRTTLTTSGKVLYTADNVCCHIVECKAGDTLKVTSSVSGVPLCYLVGKIGLTGLAVELLQASSTNGIVSVASATASPTGDGTTTASGLNRCLYLGVCERSSHDCTSHAYSVTGTNSYVSTITLPNSGTYLESMQGIVVPYSADNTVYATAYNVGGYQSMASAWLFRITLR